MSSAIQQTPPDNTTAMLDAAVKTFLAGRNPNTQRVYAARVDEFVDWYGSQPPQPFIAALKNYVTHLREERGNSKRTVQAKVNTIKGLIKTAAALYPPLVSQLPALDLVDTPVVRGQVQGTRLTGQQRQRLINAPGTDTHKGRRDTAILALLSVCGLRRSEICALDWRHIDELDGHKVIRNLEGKHGRVRTVKLPPALWRLIHRWANEAGISKRQDAPVFVQVLRGDNVTDSRLTGGAIAYIVTEYARATFHEADERSAWGITPHDLRRTAAALARKGGASIEQVQAMLGHASPQTTSDYIGESLDLDDHAVDYADVRIPD